MNICIYGGSHNEIEKKYIEAGEALGEALARRGHSMVFGGGAAGLMGAAARGTTRGGGSITGIAPSFFNVDGVIYEHCTELIYVETMRERKRLMEEHSDAFIMTPGGIGTFDEFFEILTLKHLGRHQKPIAVLNTADYYAPMEEMLRHAVRHGFLNESRLSFYRMFAEPEALLDWLEAQ